MRGGLAPSGWGPRLPTIRSHTVPMAMATPEARMPRVALTMTLVLSPPRAWVMAGPAWGAWKAAPQADGCRQRQGDVGYVSRASKRRRYSVGVVEKVVAKFCRRVTALPKPQSAAT